MNLEKYDFDRMWSDFKKYNVPKEAGPNQVQQTQQAFYAGAHIMAELFQLVPMAMSEAEAIKALDHVTSQITEWIKSKIEEGRRISHGSN